MAIILSEPKVASGKLATKLGCLRSHLTLFFDALPEIRACAFVIATADALRKRQSLTPTGMHWFRYFAETPDELTRLKKTERFAARAFWLEETDEAIAIAGDTLCEFPESAEYVAALLATREGYFWVPDIGILFGHSFAIGSYPKRPIRPVFTEETSFHAIVAAEPGFAAAMPSVVADITKAWGPSPSLTA